MLQLLGDKIQRSLLCLLTITDPQQNSRRVQALPQPQCTAPTGIGRGLAFHLSAVIFPSLLHKRGDGSITCDASILGKFLETCDRKFLWKTQVCFTLLVVRRQKAALSIPLLSIPLSTIITTTDVLELATTATAMGSTAPPACSAAPRRDGAQVQAQERGHQRRYRMRTGQSSASNPRRRLGVLGQTALP